MSHSSGYKFDRVVFKTPREQINALITEMSELKDEVEYHKADAKKWALQALRFDKWQLGTLNKWRIGSRSVTW